MPNGTEVRGLKQPPKRRPPPRVRKPRRGKFTQAAPGGARSLRTTPSASGARFRARGPRSFRMKLRPWRPGLGLRSAFARQLLRMLGKLRQTTSAGRFRNHGFTGSRNADATGLRARKRLPLRFF